MTDVLERAALLATENDIDPMTGHGPEWGKAAPVALLIIVLMGIALYFLIKSMNKQMKKVPPSFDLDTPSEPGKPAQRSGADLGLDADEGDQAVGEGTRGQEPGSRRRGARDRRFS